MGSNVLSITSQAKWFRQASVAFLAALFIFSGVFAVTNQSQADIENPIEISSWEDLDNVRRDLSGDYRLMVDLGPEDAGYNTYASELANLGSGWAPYGTDDIPFTGTFDGNEHSITGLTINHNDISYASMFGVIEDAEIMDLGLVDVDITGGYYTAPLVGHVITGKIISTYATGTLTNNSSTGAGGLVGYNSGSIVDSYADVDITATTSYVGGLVGTNLAHISTSYATGDIVASSNVGGLVGQNTSYAIITNSYASGAVHADVNSAGGLIGTNDSDTVTVNTYASGAVTAAEGLIGGLIGNNGSTHISNSFFDSTVNDMSGSGLGSSTGITGLSTIDMMTQSNFETAGWDFTDVWLTGDGTYPLLFQQGLFLGSGTTADPYHITSCGELQMIAYLPGMDYKVDVGESEVLDCAETATWNGDGAEVESFAGFLPIKYFSGEFNGNDVAISNLYINHGGNGAGLFGYLTNGAYVHDFALVNADVTGNYDVGVLAGAVYNSVISNGSVNGEANAQGTIGGAAGYVENTTIDMVDADVTVNVADNTAGGLVGYLYTGGIISNSAATGSVTSNNLLAGGLVGNSYGNIINSFAIGNVSASGTVGGLVGSLQSVAKVVNAFARGDVAVGATTGGGLVGYAESGAIIYNAYSSGHISGEALQLGGFIGSNYATIMNSFWDDQVNEGFAVVGEGNTTGIADKNTSELQTTSTFTDVNWDFDYIWTMIGPGEYPMLQRQGLYPGSGTENDPYVISNCTQLQDVRWYLASHFIAGGDIDCSDTATWNNGQGFFPIGGELEEDHFIGTFDGEGARIFDLFIDRNSNYIGLFGVIGSGAQVSNLSLEDATISGSDYVGGLTGGLIGRVINAHVSGVVDGGANDVGGLVGVHTDGIGSGSSSPLVFGWNGTEYDYLADVGRGIPRNVVGTDYNQIDGDELVPKDGKYSMNISEEYNEIVYYDKLALKTFDHVPGYRVLTSLQRSKEGQFSTVSENPSHPVVSCVDRYGADCTAAVQADDDEWTNRDADNINYVTVNFGDLSGQEHINLLFTGARDFSLDAKESLKMIQVKNAEGNWVNAISPSDISSPIGAPRTYVVDMAGKFVSDNYDVRIGFSSTSVNYMAVDTAAQVEVTEQTIQPEAVDLQFRGYSAIDKTHYWDHDFNSVSNKPEELFSYQWGKFTKYGEVAPLLQATDDQFVIMRHGDNMNITFDYTEPAEGLERDFILDNWVTFKHAKMGPVGLTVEPLPFNGMTKYPYESPEAYPATPENLEYLRTWNTREFKPRGTGSTIIDSMSSANVSGQFNVGGLVGENHKPVVRSYAIGDVSGFEGSGVGGFAGANFGPITDSYSLGSVTSSTGSAGGFVGDNYGTIKSSYTAGILNSETTGGFVGARSEDTITDAYWDTERSGSDQGCNCESQDGLTGATTVQMQTKITYPEFSYQTPYSLQLVDDEATYQYLKFNFTKRKGVTSETGIQITDIHFTNNAKPVTIPSYATATNPGGNKIDGWDEGASSVIDGIVATKWLDYAFKKYPGETNEGYSDLIIDMGNEDGITFDGYTFTTANDAPDRDPASWTVYGSSDGINWTLLDERNNQVLTDDRDTLVSGVNAGWDYVSTWGLNPDENSGYPFLQTQGFANVDPEEEQPEEEVPEPEPESPELPVNFINDGKGDGSGDKRADLGRAVSFEALPNNLVRIHYKKGDSKLFQCFVNGKGVPRVALTKKGGMFLCFRQNGKEANLFDSYTGKKLGNAQLMRKDLSGYRKRIFNFDRGNKNESAFVTAVGKEVRVRLITVNTHTKKVVSVGKAKIKTDQQIDPNQLRVLKYKGRLQIRYQGKTLRSYYINADGSLTPKQQAQQQ